MDREATNSPTKAPDSIAPELGIFICYRRAVSAMDAVHLYDHLSQAFGETVFIDHECLRGGQHWRGRIG